MSSSSLFPFYEWFESIFLFWSISNFVSPDSYSDICYLGTDELIIFVSFLWMIWVDLPFLTYLSIYLSFVFCFVLFVPLILYLLNIFLFSFRYQNNIFRIAVSVYFFSLNSSFSFFLRKLQLAFLSEKTFLSAYMHLHTKVEEKITGGWCLHNSIRLTRALTSYSLSCW